MAIIVKNQPKAGEFFQLRPDDLRGGKGHGVVFENERISFDTGKACAT